MRSTAESLSIAQNAGRIATYDVNHETGQSVVSDNFAAITGLPVRQSVAMTGAIDQHGNVMPVGAVNEKIEGFFDVCRARGLTG
ncbi:MAG: hypothetical protein HC872_03295, partial [Gammaproteobacteria bacterium]|nr:hypothetical protein [Gammaproteobacteria bacterium]